MRKPFFWSRLLVEELEPWELVSSVGPGVTGEWALPATAAALARATAGPGSNQVAVVQGRAAAGRPGTAPTPNIPTAATRAARVAAPAAQTPPMVALSGAFGQAPFGPALDSGLADPLGGAANAPRAARGAAGAPAVALVPLPAVGDTPPPAASAPVPVAQGAAGTAPAAPSLPLLPLLPTTGTHAGAAHRGPAAPKTSPFTLDPGPGPMAVTCNIILNAPSFVPVNADDDNGSAVTPTGAGIPAKRDFDVAPIPGGDPELLAAFVTVNCNVPGELAWTVIYNGPNENGGNIALWTDNKKSAPVAGAWQVPANPPTYSFFVEGTHESWWLHFPRLSHKTHRRHGKGV